MRITAEQNIEMYLENMGRDHTPVRDERGEEGHPVVGCRWRRMVTGKTEIKSV